MKRDIQRLEQAYNQVNQQFYCGFPGIGKSYFAKRTGCSDSDSSKFPKDENWPQNYIDHLKTLSGVVLISTHKDVRDALDENGLEFSLIYPKRELKDEYINRYKERGSPESFISLLDKMWDAWITEMETEDRAKQKIVLDRGQFASDALRK